MKRLVVILIGLFLFTACGNQANQNSEKVDESQNQEVSTTQQAASDEQHMKDGGGKDYTKGDSYTIKIAHVALDDTPIGKGMIKLKELVEEKTAGRVKVDIYANSKLGGNRELIEQLQMGTLEMAAPSCAFLGGFTKGTALFDLPYLFDTPEGAWAVFDSEIGKNILAGLESSGIVGLNFYGMGWRVVSTNKEVHEAKDMKGLKIRVMENPMHIDHFNSLGASAIPMSFSEVYTSLQQGVIQAQENPYSQIYTQKFYEVQKYIINTNHIYDPVPLICSKSWWDGLSKDDQEMIRDCSNEACDWERSLVEETDKKTQEELKNKITIIDLTDEQRETFKKASKPVYDKYTSEIGQDVIDQAQKIQSEASKK